MPRYRLILLVSSIILLGVIGMIVYRQHNQPTTYQAASTPAAQVLRITSPDRPFPQAPNTASLLVKGKSTMFFTPYIQTRRDIRLSAIVGSNYIPNGGGVQYIAYNTNKNWQTEQFIMNYPYNVVFAGMSPGNYRIDAYVVDSKGKRVAGTGRFDRMTDLGVGDIAIAIGDEVTEGWNGGSFTQPIIYWWEAPAGSFSTDRRNFPQLGIGKKTFQKSFLTEANNVMSSINGYPIFIDNEGWGTYKIADYANLVNDATWKGRVSALAPNKFLIQLGGIDGANGLSASAYKASLSTMIDRLKANFGVLASNIIISTPVYCNTFATAGSYGRVIDELVREKGVSKGPDAWNYFKNNPDMMDHSRYLNSLGMIQMGRLWATSLVKPSGVRMVQSGSSVQVSWDNLASKLSTITSYELSIGTQSGSYSQIINVGNVTGKAVTGLSIGKVYYFRLVAVDASGVRTSGSEVSITLNSSGNGSNQSDDVKEATPPAQQNSKPLINSGTKTNTGTSSGTSGTTTKTTTGSTSTTGTSTTPASTPVIAGDPIPFDTSAPEVGIDTTTPIDTNLDTLNSEATDNSTWGKVKNSFYFKNGLFGLIGLLLGGGVYLFFRWQQRKEEE